MEDFCRAPTASAVSVDARSVMRVLCTTSGDPPVMSARLTVTDVATGRDATTLDVKPNSDRAAREAALTAMKAFVAKRRWAALVPYSIEDDTSVPDRFHGLGLSRAHVATGEGLRVQFHEPELVVTNEKGKVVLRGRYPAWSPHRGALGQSCIWLTDLGDAMGNRAVGVLVLGLDSTGSPHFCEGGRTERIVHLPPSP